MQWNKGAYFEMTTQAFYLGEGELLGQNTAVMILLTVHVNSNIWSNLERILISILLWDDIIMYYMI